MAARVMQGDVFQLLESGAVEKGSIDVVCTSPPYWKLRSYLPKDHPLKALELGSEPTPAAFVQSLVRVFGLVREAMADHATLWVNIGDTYCNSGSRNNGTGLDGKRRGGMKDTRGDWESAKESYGDIRHTLGLDTGSLCLIPQRLAIALQDDGWLVRSVICWHKPSAMPASLSGWMWRRCRVKVKATPRGAEARRSAVNPERPKADHAANGKDFAQAEWADCPGCRKCEKNGGLVLRRGSWRPTSSYEPVLMLAKTDRYYCDGIAVQTPAAQATLSRDRYTRVLDDPDEQYAVAHDHETDCGGAANLRDVWTVSAEPLSAGICETCGHFVQNVSRLKKYRKDPEDKSAVRCPKCAGKFGSHYAAFPTALVSNCLRAGTSSRGYCRRCGAPWCRVVDGGGAPRSEAEWSQLDRCGEGASGGGHHVGIQGGAALAAWRANNPTRTLGWRPSCSCDAGEPRPGRVLDCFAGSGRTGLEAQRLGLDFVGVELHPDYAEMSRRLLREDMPLFNREDAPAAGREE